MYWSPKMSPRLFIGFNVLMLAVMVVFGAVNAVRQDWLFFGSNIVIASTCLAAIVVAKRGSVDRAASVELVHIGALVTATMFAGIHFYDASFAVDRFMLPFVMTQMTLAGVFLEQRRRLVYVVGYSLTAITAHVVLVAVAGEASAVEWLSPLTFAIVAAAGAMSFQRLRERLISSTKRAEHNARARQEFLASMSHEIRTPLSGVSGLVDIIAADPERRTPEYAAHLRTALDDLRAIVDDILDFEKNRTNEIVLRPEPFSPDSVLRQVAELFAHRAARVPLVVAEPVPDQPYIGDASRIRQILRNLIDNALKFTEFGRVTLSCTEVDLADANDTALVFTVTDTGRGMTREALARIFEPFYQTDDDSSKSHTGTGLGLAICRQLVTAMGGEICVESNVDTGTRFDVTLPLPRGTEPEPETPATPVSKDWARQTVILAEDEPMNAMVVKHHLVTLGHEVIHVSDGYGAVAEFQNGSPDLILMDAQMPGMDGETAIKTIRELETTRGAQHPRTPIVGLTAYATTSDHDRLRAAGADAVLVKPASQTELEAAIERHIGTAGSVAT
jgi:signal transduction histidine kinase/ActR/RegA family two-component response regulator